MLPILHGIPAVASAAMAGTNCERAIFEAAKPPVVPPSGSKHHDAIASNARASDELTSAFESLRYA
ncbi:hypothetical protein BRAS3843_640006 [Bradyrhizobium sp. STM 3843]|nr:hypothetical protein BRAS3843_640006 [Bradyrhizobium sp. STM 3843]